MVGDAFGEVALSNPDGSAASDEWLEGLGRDVLRWRWLSAGETRAFRGGRSLHGGKHWFRESGRGAGRVPSDGVGGADRVCGGDEDPVGTVVVLCGTEVKTLEALGDPRAAFVGGGSKARTKQPGGAMGCASYEYEPRTAAKAEICGYVGQERRRFRVCSACGRRRCQA